jgi:hypothetical protein
MVKLSPHFFSKKLNECLLGLFVIFISATSTKFQAQVAYISTYIPAYQVSIIKTKNFDFKVDSTQKSTISAGGQFCFKGDAMASKSDFIWGIDMTQLFNMLLRGKNAFKSGRSLGSFGVTYGSLIYFKFGVQKKANDKWNWGLAYNFGIKSLNGNYVATGLTFVNAIKLNKKIYLQPKLIADLAFLMKGGIPKNVKVFPGKDLSADFTIGLKGKKNWGLSVSPIFNRIAFVFEDKSEIKNKSAFTAFQLQVGIAKMF